MNLHDGPSMNFEFTELVFAMSHAADQRYTQSRACWLVRRQGMVYLHEAVHSSFL